MSILKKREKYKHIGLALVPPVAFTAVPDSPPPNPRGKKLKTKVVASPIGPFALFAHKTAQAIALGSARGVLEHVDISYDETDGNPSFLESDELYAQVKRRSSARTRHQFIDEDETIPFESTAVEQQQPLSDAESFSEIPRGLNRKHQRSKPVGKKDARRTRARFDSESPIKPSTSGKVQLMSPQDGARSNTSHSPRAAKDVAARQDVLEEEMRLRDEQNREMILNLMKNKQDGASRGGDNPDRASPFDDEISESRTSKSRHLDDPEKLQELADLLKEQSMSGAEGVMLREQIQEMIDENQVLKDTVHRLNIELSKYQEKYGDDPRALDGAKGIPVDQPVPNWLVDPKYLSPLFASYDRQMERRNETIAKYEAEAKELTKQVEEIVAENNTLRAITKDKRMDPFVSQEKWDNVREQNNLMVEEIQVLMEQLELMELKAREMHARHVDEVARLSKRLAISDAEYQQAEKERKNLKDEQRELQEKFDQLKISSNEKVEARDHVRMAASFKNDIEDLKERHLQEQTEFMSKLKEVQKEKSDALLKLAEEKAATRQLEGEVDAIKSSRMNLSSEIEQLRENLSETERREIECQLHLANAIRVAERASIERATLASLAEREQKSAHLALERSMREKWELGRMEETLKNCKVELANKNKNVSDRLREVEDTHIGHLREQELEMIRLRKLLQQKQRDLDDMARSKKQIENELETVWQAAHRENRIMMETLHKSKVIL